jgi:UDPglucose--hexose-1-phosphate uridylyltransferase
MAQIKFNRKEMRTTFLDPGNGFARKELVLEVREDLLTGRRSRILPFRRRELSVKETSLDTIESSKKGCPFCPAQIDSLTPKFVPEIAPEGRIRRGDALAFPNSFPYTQYNWVIVLSKDHFLPLDRFTGRILIDGFGAGQEAIGRLARNEPGLRYWSINWNYFPQSGGGLFHPHIQVVIEESPTSSHQGALAGILRYQSENRSLFWQDYLSEEMKLGERYLGSRGDIHFLMAFSPSGVLGEIFIIFSNRFLIEDVTPKDWEDFSHGLLDLFRFFKVKHIESFNFSLFAGSDDAVRGWIFARLCPRMSLPPWNTSDINYFEKLHGEVICIISPEEWSQEIKPFLK